jgi:hypothetical protein
MFVQQGVPSLVISPPFPELGKAELSYPLAPIFHPDPIVTVVCHYQIYAQLYRQHCIFCHNQSLHPSWVNHGTPFLIWIFCLATDLQPLGRSTNIRWPSRPDPHAVTTSHVSTLHTIYPWLMVCLELSACTVMLCILQAFKYGPVCSSL